MKRIRTGYPNVFFTEHKTRKHNGKLDRYFLLRYRVDGRQVEEGLGWLSNRWNAVRAAGIMAELKRNQRTGKGPKTLKEKRALDKNQRDAEAEQREFVKVFERAIQDRVGFLEFLNEVGQLVKRLVAGQLDDPRDVLRAVHTIKGNCSLFNATSVAAVAHEMETKLLDEAADLTDEEVQRLGSTWGRLSDRLAAVMEIDSKDRVEVAQAELDELVRATLARTPHDQLAQRLEELKHEPAVTRFQRVKRQARALASRLGKAVPTVVCDGGGVRLPAERWAPFWSAFVHVVRNAIDHGIETPEERVAVGKPAHGKLTLRARKEGDDVTIQVSDDGRGIDWTRVRERAQAAGLPHQNQAALVDALFAEGLSTSQNVTSVSGRGVGLSALREACRALEGSIRVTSNPGSGTTFLFRFPVKLRG